MRVTVDTITDAQIVEMMKKGDRNIRILCKNALDDAPIYLKKSIVRDARRRLAAIYNQQHGDKP